LKKSIKKTGGLEEKETQRRTVEGSETSKKPTSGFLLFNKTLILKPGTVFAIPSRN